MGYSFRLAARYFYMHHPTYRIAYTTAFVTPVVEHWLKREIARSDTLIPIKYLLKCYWFVGILFVCVFLFVFVCFCFAVVVLFLFLFFVWCVCWLFGCCCVCFVFFVVFFFCFVFVVCCVFCVVFFFISTIENKSPIKRMNNYLILASHLSR